MMASSNSAIDRRDSVSLDHWNRNTHMYGRDFELSSLSAAFSRTIARYATDAKSEVVLVSGLSGTGKTFFVKNGMAEIMSSSSGFYASGKCAQLEQNHPYSCVVDLFTSLCNRVSEEEKEMPSCKIRSGIRQSLQAEDCYILSGLIPKIGEMLDLSTTSTSDSQNNENLHSSGKEQHACVLRSLRRFVRAVASWGTVVLFLDDLQWVSFLRVFPILQILDGKWVFMTLSLSMRNRSTKHLWTSFNYLC